MGTGDVFGCDDLSICCLIIMAVAVLITLPGAHLGIQASTYVGGRIVLRPCSEQRDRQQRALLRGEPRVDVADQSHKRACFLLCWLG